MSSLLPPNASALEQNVAQSLGRLSSVPVPFEAVIDPLRASEDILPWLAWWFSVDAWATDWPVYVRRRTVQQSLKIHRKKGTVGAMLDAIDAIGVPVKIEEWHQRSPNGEPYTFRALVDSVVTPFQPADVQRLLQAIDDNKNLRSHLSELVPGLTSYASPKAVAATAVGVEREVEARFADISLLLSALEEGDASVERAADALYMHLHTTLPYRSKELP